MSVDPRTTVVIANPWGAGGRVGREWGRIGPGLLRALGAVEVLRTERTGHAQELARDAVRRGKRTVLAMGGDGTLGEVVDGILAAAPARGEVTLGVLPAGTGGDFKRLLVAQGDPVEAAERLRDAAAVPVDVGLARFVGADGAPRERAFLNLASIGMGALVCTYVNASKKRLGGKLTFAWCTLRALGSWQPALVRFCADGEDLGEHLLDNAAIANGRFAGGGMCFAPGARLDDGALDVTVVPHLPPLRSARHLTKLYDGRVLEIPGVRSGRGRVIEATSADPAREVGIELDGEPVGRLPARFEALSGAIRLLGARSEALAGTAAGASAATSAR